MSFFEKDLDNIFGKQEGFKGSIPFRPSLPKKRSSKLTPLTRAEKKELRSQEINSLLKKRYEGEKISSNTLKEMEAAAAQKAKESGIKTVAGGEITKGVGEDAIKKAAAKKSLQLKSAAKDAGKAMLADAVVKNMGTDSNTAHGAAMESGMSTLMSTGNPYMALGAAAVGAVQGEHKRRARNKKLAADAITTSAQAHSTASAQKQAAMRSMSSAFQGYFS